MTAENAGVIAAEMYLPHFVVKQKLTMMVNRYEISESDAAGNPTRLMARPGPAGGLPGRGGGRGGPRRADVTVRWV